MSPLRLVPALLGLLLLSACADRPPVDELTSAIVAAAGQDPTVDVTNDQARCIAERLLDSGLSDTTLAGLAENFDSPEVLSDEKDDVEPLVAAAATACIVDG